MISDRCSQVAVVDFFRIISRAHRGDALARVSDRVYFELDTFELVQELNAIGIALEV